MIIDHGVVCFRCDILMSYIAFVRRTFGTSRCGGARAGAKVPKVYEYKTYRTCVRTYFARYRRHETFRL